MRARWWIAAVAGAAVATFVAIVVRGSGHPPDAVQPIAWSREPCAHCKMLIDDPSHAAQLVTVDGDVLSFDDPGCAMRYLDEHRPSIHALWFHHAHEPRWLAAEDARFVTGATTPMGSGLAAVDRDTPGALDLGAAREREARR